MALTHNQIEITQEFRTRLREELKDYENAPADVKGPLDELWVAFKETAKFDDDNQADLAAFGALAQFARLADQFDEQTMKSLLTLFSTSILAKVKKGDRLD
jgi:ribosomal protein L16 Arg81 hydroxylase